MSKCVCTFIKQEFKGPVKLWHDNHTACVYKKTLSIRVSNKFIIIKYECCSNKVSFAFYLIMI
jgi:hypothetical protein